MSGQILPDPRATGPPSAWLPGPLLGNQPGTVDIEPEAGAFDLNPHGAIVQKITATRLGATRTPWDG